MFDFFIFSFFKKFLVHNYTFKKVNWERGERVVQKIHFNERLFKVVIAQRGGLSDNFAPSETTTVDKRVPGTQDLNDVDEIECVGVSSFIRNMSMAEVWHADDDITPEISLDSFDLKFEGNETGEQTGESIELGFMKTFSKLNVGVFDSTEGERTTGELESTISQQLVIHSFLGFKKISTVVLIQ